MFLTYLPLIQTVDNRARPANLCNPRSLFRILGGSLSSHIPKGKARGRSKVILEKTLPVGLEVVISGQIL